MGDKRTKILTIFKTTLIQFLDELIDQFPSESDLVIARVMISDQIPIADVMNVFSQKIEPYKEKIKERDDKFFLENTSLFTGANENSVINLKKIWSSTKLDTDDREVIWNWIDIFVKLSTSIQKN
jgi:hypothetical protein